MLKLRSPYSFHDRGGYLWVGYLNPFVMHLKNGDRPPEEARMAEIMTL